MEKKIYRVKLYKGVETEKGIGFVKVNGFDRSYHRSYEAGSLISEVGSGETEYHYDSFEYDEEADARARFEQIKAGLDTISMRSSFSSKYFYGSVVELELVHANVDEDSDIDEYDWESLDIAESALLVEDEDKNED